MQTHPVPQDIATYQFKLVGDMTLKQFMFLAIGALLGLAVWKLPIPFLIIRLPLAMVPIIGGVLGAFVPINGRPFSQWVSAFFKAIYSPTVYEYEIPAQAKIIYDPTNISKSTKTPALSFTSAITQAVGIKPKETTSSVFVAPPPPAPSGVPILPTDEVGYIPTEKPSVTPRLIPIDTKEEVKVVIASSLVTHTPSPTTPTANLTSSIASPTSPNILIGLVVDPNQVSLAGATVEIIDSKTGIPTRALRTNRLGQFQIAIPLPNGKYTLQVEKDNFKFNPVSITVNSSIIKPVLLSAISADASSPVIPNLNNQISKY